MHLVSVKFGKRQLTLEGRKYIDIRQVPVCNEQNGRKTLNPFLPYQIDLQRLENLYGDGKILDPYLFINGAGMVIKLREF